MDIITPFVLNDTARLPPGIYRITDTEPASVEDVARSLAGGSLPDSEGSTPGHFAFFWAAEAAYYFCLDNVYDEVAIGPRYRGLKEPAVVACVHSLLDEVGLGYLIPTAHSVSPTELSGGQQQRLLVAVILSRETYRLLGIDPLVYVEEDARTHLFRLVAEMVRRHNGTLAVWSSDEDLPPDVFCAKLRFPSSGVLLPSASTVSNCFAPTPPLSPAAVDSTFQHPVCNPYCPRLLLRNASWRYSNGTVGVTVPSAQFHQGQVYVICGPNGGGKSSLIRLLTARNRLPRDAEVRFDGASIINPYRQLVARRRISFTFQDPNVHISGGTVGAFITAAGTCRDIATDLGLLPYLAEDMLAAPLWVRQAAVFATAVANHSPLLALDEPIDGTARRVFGDAAVRILRREAADGATVLLVTHSSALARAIADAYLWVSQGTAAPVRLSRDTAHNEPLHKWLGRQ